MLKLRVIALWSRSLHTPSAVLSGAVPALQLSTPPPPATVIQRTPALPNLPSSSSASQWSPPLPAPPVLLRLSSAALSPRVARMSGAESPPPPSSSADQPSDRSHDLPSEDTLLKMADFLSKDINNLLFKNMNYQMYRPDLVFENRVTGQVTHGLHAYHTHYRNFKIKHHVKYFLANTRSQSVVIHTRTGGIVIKWQVLGLKMSNFLLHYFPKKLWLARNRFEAMEVVQAGVSTYYIDGQAQVYRVIYDNKDKDEPTTDKSQVDKIKEQLQKLKPQAQPAAPVM
ncbi:hypothetical protein TCAL_11620 [Tigriopus californicus]|uniref:Uncharacterized protein n=1 Tax=Tigriopus californicus TaxID=6832 RepID=A0A553NZU4_TIGCA|nr:uncharacterized protein LOC131887472 [Tigriopus californicus]TRY70960.1 hypothetical protein TCAL_11620 [Tigriopus californicus]|eukprot:TCALIF_11620-PA protein Name:"Protein of unknown function" AED:0.23 eAED:0.23 QI:0/-1/0/1/-1/1/1/0/283